MKVKSVYNFVPAPKESEVFKPEWADQVSHDIPFSDGESGEIEISITAETPIFIRNGHSKDNESNEFSHYIIDGEKKYFIPATSLKGMFRNVLEIISNSKMTLINNHRHSIRQIMRVKGVVMDEEYELSQDDVKRSIRCGYLIKEGERYFIYSCGIPLKIRYTDIDRKYGRNFSGQFGILDEANLSENFDHRTASYKYKLLEGCNLEGKFEIHPLDEDDKQKSWVSQYQPLRYARFARYDEGQTFDGTIVLVGQASNYNVSTARRGEYVFKGEKSKILGDVRNRLEVPAEKIEDFKFVNRDGKGESVELKDWTHWKGEIKSGIPVFYRTRKQRGQEEIVDFGLPFSYKQPTKYKTKDLLPEYSNDMDLAETIFGSIQKNSESKGRVFIGNACCIDSNPKLKDEVVVTLGSPKSSYTPFYLNQQGNNGKTAKYNTYNTGGELRGFKRYPIKKKIYDYSGESIKMQSRFIPLEKGTKFKAKIRFHNLRALEIGALISAITLNDTSGTLHNLGYAKPLGYGQVKIDEIKVNGLAEEHLFYSKKFQVEMQSRFGSLWIKRVNELLSMSYNSNNSPSIDLEYNNLESFQEIKDTGEYLQEYSAYGVNYNYNPNLDREVQIRVNEIEEERTKKIETIQSLKKEIELLTNQKEYDKVIQKIEELNTLDKVSNKLEWIEEIKKQSDENQRKIAVDQMVKRNDIGELKDFIEKNPFHERADEIRGIIRTIGPVEYPERYRKIDLKMLLREVPSWIRKNKVNVEDFETELYSDFKRVIKDDLSKKNREKYWMDIESKNTWGKVELIIGKNAMLSLFKELIKQ